MQRTTGYLTDAVPLARVVMVVYNVWFHVWKTFVPRSLYDQLNRSGFGWPYPGARGSGGWVQQAIGQYAAHAPYFEGWSPL